VNTGSNSNTKDMRLRLLRLAPRASRTLNLSFPPSFPASRFPNLCLDHRRAMKGTADTRPCISLDSMDCLKGKDFDFDFDLA